VSTTGLKGRTVKRSPIPALDGLELADLAGHVLEVELVSGHVLRFRRNVLTWLPGARACVWFQGGRRGPGVSGRPTGRAADARRRWTGRPPRGETVLSMPAFGGSWRSYGRTRRIDYHSKKWARRGPEYTHDTTTGPTLYCLGSTGPALLWVLRGGGLNLTTGGLIG